MTRYHTYLDSSTPEGQETILGVQQNGSEFGIGISSTIQIENLNILNSVGIGTTDPTETFDVRGNVSVSGITTTQHLLVTGVTTFVGATTLGITSTSNFTTQTLSVSGISTLGVTTITNLTSQTLNISGITTLGVTSTTNLTSQTLSVSGISTFQQIAGNCLASVTDVVGINTTGVTTSGSAVVTLIGSALASSIANGDSVIGTGITPGTIVSSGGGTSQLILNSNVNSSLSSNKLTFHKNTKVLTPSSVGGQLCRAWVNFDGSTTVSIRTSFNTSSITDNASGDYTMNFTTAMPDIDFVPIGLGYETGANRACIMMGDSSNDLILTTSSVRFRAFRGGSSTAIDDPARMCVLIFR